MSEQKPPQLLIIEDQQAVRELLKANLQAAGYSVTACGEYAEGVQTIISRKFDVAILDVNLTDGSGFDLVRKAREAGVTFPIIMLTGSDETESRVAGLDAGADDYLVKPFEFSELQARLRALLRRARPIGETIAGQRLTLGPRWVRLDTGESETNEGPLTLSAKELRLLRLLVARENEVLTRADILEEVWGMNSFPTDRTVDNFILRLRKLFEPVPDEPRHIITLRARGYMFKR